MRTVLLALLVFLFAGCHTARSPLTPVSDESSAQPYLKTLGGYGFSGAVLFHYDDGPDTAQGYGLADRARGVPITSRTVFDLGSLTKQFAAAAVLSLVEDGILDLSESISAYLPGVPADKEAITLHHLLSHSSGLVRHVGMMGLEEDVERDAFVEATLASDLQSAPGEDYEYSDVGYDLVAAIVEVVTSESFQNVVAERVIDPAGMERTGYWTDGRWNQADVALSYRGNLGSARQDNIDGPSAAGWSNLGSGGLLSTVEDLGRWDEALRHGRVLSVASRALMEQPHTEIRPGLAYGYGWFVQTTPEGMRLFHGGDIRGYKAMLQRFPSQGVTVIGLGNSYGWEPVFNDQLGRLALGERLPAPPPVVSVPDAPDAFDGVEGVYRMRSGDSLLVWAEGRGLLVAPLGQRAANRVAGLSDERVARSVETNATAKMVVDGLMAGDATPLRPLLRDRDRFAGLDRRILRYWQLRNERSPAERAELIATVPAQDETDVTFMHLHRSGFTELLRIVWRAGVFVTIGFGDSLPTLAYQPIGDGHFATYVPSSGEVVTLDVIGRQLAIDGAYAAEYVGTDGLPLRSGAAALLPVFLTDGVDAGRARYRALLDHDRYALDEDETNNLGYSLLHADAVESAIAVFQFNVDRFPRSWNAYDSLGEACAQAGQTEAAIRNYERSIELNPDNTGGARILEQLRSRH